MNPELDSLLFCKEEASTSREETPLEELLVSPDCDQNEPVQYAPVHNSWVSTEGDETPVYVCMWGNCRASLENEQQFRVHVNAHIERLSEEMTNEMYLPCPIVGCGFATNYRGLMASHLTMHVHHATQQMEGLQHLIENHKELVSIKDCGFPSSLHVDYDGLNITCLWDYCHEEFYDVNAFFEHVMRHAQLTQREDVFKGGNLYCGWNSCKKMIKNRGEFKRHVSVHIMLRRCACPCCGTYLSSLDNLVEHMKRRLPEEMKPFECVMCHQKFADQQMLMRHMNTHLHNAQCELCNVIFRTKSEKEKHYMKMHIEIRVRNFVCEVEGCYKGFLSQVDLDQHSRKHREPEIQCKSCEMKFHFSAQLVRHRAEVHTVHKVEGNKYMCHLCEGLFTRGDKLSKHLRSKHTFPIPEGFNRYTYRQCSDGYFRLQTKKHLRSHLSSL